MTDAEYRREKGRISRLAEKWIGPLWLKWWKIKIAYGREPGEASDRDPSAYQAAKCAADWQYAHATVTFNLPELTDMSDEDLEYVFVHELCHIFLNEMREEGLPHEERVATSLARAFIEVHKASYRAGLRDARKTKRQKR